MFVKKSDFYMVIGLVGIILGIMATWMGITEPSEADYAFCIGIPALIVGVISLSRAIHHIKRQF